RRVHRDRRRYRQGRQGHLLHPGFRHPPVRLPMRQTTGLLCAALALVLTVRPGSADDREKKEPPKPELTDGEKEVLALTNKEREKAGLPPLKANPVLCKVARAHSANIVKQMKPDHVLDGKSFADRIKDAGYRARLSGENIGFARGSWTAQGIVN